MSASNSQEPGNFNPSNHPIHPPTYSHISSVPISSTHKLISLAGQVGMSDPNNPNPSLRDQVRIALENVDLCLEAAGCTKKDIVALRQYLVKYSSMSKEDQDARAEEHDRWWKSTGGKAKKPPSTLVGVESLYTDGCVYEVEVQAVGRL